MLVEYSLGSFYYYIMVKELKYGMVSDFHLLHIVFFRCQCGYLYMFSFYLFSFSVISLFCWKENFIAAYYKDFLKFCWNPFPLITIFTNRLLVYFYQKICSSTYRYFGNVIYHNFTKQMPLSLVSTFLSSIWFFPYVTRLTNFWW